MTDNNKTLVGGGGGGGGDNEGIEVKGVGGSLPVLGLLQWELSGSTTDTQRTVTGICPVMQ